MFQVEIAGLVIALDNRYESTRSYCEGYLTDSSRRPDFTITVSEEELRRRAEECPDMIWNALYAEPICIYEKLSCAIVQKDAFVLHSSVVAVDGRAYAFAADCGVGKTTHTRHWQNLMQDRLTVINGDKPVYRFMGDQLMAFGTPWCGKEKLETNTSAPLAALCLLQRGDINQVEQIDGFEHLGEITRHVYLPGNNQIDILRMMDLFERMLETVPVYRLICRDEPEAAVIAYEGLHKK